MTHTMLEPTKENGWDVTWYCYECEQVCTWENHCACCNTAAHAKDDDE